MVIMKVLTITNMWPVPEQPYYGIFVEEQVTGLRNYYPEIDNRILFINGLTHKYNYVLSIVKINWHLLFCPYDVIHLHSALSGLFLLFYPKRKNVIITLHGTDITDPQKYKISKHVIKKARELICVSEEIETIVKKQVPNTPTHILPCAVRTNFFVDEKEKKTNDRIKIAFPASKNRPEKNYAFFQQIIDSLEKEKGIDVEIIEIFGKSRSEVCIILNEIDVLIMTSISEGSPQIIKEAMCCNVPIVSSNVGDIALLLKDVKNCKVIHKFDKQMFVEAVVNVLNCKAKERLSNGREQIFALGLDEKTTSCKMYNIYKKLKLAESRPIL